MKALVVEGSNTMRSVLARILSMRGVDVVGTDNSRQAIELLHVVGALDIVLVDWSLDEAEILEFISKLRHESAKNTVILMLASVEPGRRTLHRAMLAGADDYLLKPFTAMQIDEKLAESGIATRSDATAG